MAAPSGWFPDPQGRFEYRYFNGVQWTSDVAIDGKRYVDSVAAPPPSQGGPSPRPRGMAIASFVTGAAGVATGWVPFVFVLAIASGIAAIVFGIIGLRTAKRNDGYGRGLAIAGLALAPVAFAVCVGGFFFSRAVLHEVQDFIDPGPHEVVVTTCTISDGRAALTGTIRNTDAQTHDYRVVIEFDAGAETSTITVAVPHVAAGATAPLAAATDLSGTAVTCKVNDVFGPLPFDAQS